MIDTPEFSIVMPSYNQAAFIGRAIRSVLNQDFQSWELLIIDNHSDAATVSAIDSFQDPRIRLIKISNDGIIAKSRNLGILNASAPWIAFLDSDDTWYPDKLTTINKVINNRAVDLIYHDMHVVRNDKIEGKIKSRRARRNVHRQLLIHGNFIANSSVVVRKSELQKVGLISEAKELVGVEDFHTWMKLSVNNKRFFYLNRILGGYRLHESNFSTKKSNLKSHLIANEFSENASRVTQNRIWGRGNYLNARDCMKIGEFDCASGFFHITLRNGVPSLKMKSLIFITALKFRIALNRKKNG